MFAPIPYEFALTEVDYRRDRLIAAFDQTARSHRRGPLRWVRGVIGAIARGQLGSGYQPEHDGPILAPGGRGYPRDPRGMASPHHVTSH